MGWRALEAWREPDEYNVFVAKTRAKELDKPTQANSRPEAASASHQQPDPKLTGKPPRHRKLWELKRPPGYIPSGRFG